MTIVAGPQAIEMRVVAVQPAESRSADNPLFAIVLEEIGGTRRMPVVMRKAEADAIAAHLRNILTSRPMTYSFMSGLLHALGGRLIEVRITRVDGGTIYASALVSGCLGTQVVDARPSDAMNLALRMGAPIRVEPSVLERLLLPDAQAEPPGLDWA